MASWGDRLPMLATERLLQIEAKFAAHVARIVAVELDGETIRLILYLKDGANLRVAEHWADSKLVRYSYYWLSADNEIKIGWDNAPPHTHLKNFPHHKHVGPAGKPEPASEASLEEVIAFVLSAISRRPGHQGN